MTGAIQFKTGRPEPGNKAAIQKALHTLALKPWKSGVGYIKNCHVIHIYVASTVAITKELFDDCFDTVSEGGDSSGTTEKIWNKEELRDRDYVCCMDMNDSGDVWGETFDALLRMMKNVK